MTETFSWLTFERKISERISRRNGWNDDRARNVAELVADAMREEYGGKRHYIPSSDPGLKKKIRAEFNGRNIAELSSKYGKSCMTIRRYCK